MNCTSDQLLPLGRQFRALSARGRLSISASAGLALAFGVTQPALAQPAEPVDLTVVPTEGDPLDLPGRGPAPKTREEVNTPVPVQSGARPETPPVPREWGGPEGRPWVEWTRMTGDWGGARTSMEAAGLTVAGSFRLDWTSVLSGGTSDGAYTRRLFDVNLTLDLDPVTGGSWKGGTVYADFYHYGGETGEPSGSVQGTDVISSASHLDQLAELWIQQTFSDGLLRLKVGKIDANAEFASIPCATGFISANGTWDVNLLDMPTYPDPAMGVVLFVTPSDGFYAGVGVFDGATHDGYPTGSRGPATFFSDSKSDSWYTIGEAGVVWKQLGSMGGGRVAAGGWYHSGDYVRFDSTIDQGTGGFYLTGQQQLTQRGETDEQKEQGLFVFARAAFANGDISTVRTHASLGLVSKGTFEGRDDDQAGVMWSWAGLSDASGAVGNESILEAYYTIAATGSVTLSPYFQWVVNPSGNPAVDDAVLIGLSLKVSF